MEKNIATTKKSNVPSTNVNQVREEVLRSDIIVPYLVITQPMTEVVAAGEQKPGQIVKSTNKLETLADSSKSLEIVFLHLPKAEWVLKQEQKDGKFKYRRAIPRNSLNEALPWDYMGDDNGDEVPAETKGAYRWKRVKRSSVFAILLSDIEADFVEKEKVAKGEFPDLNKALTPVLVSFTVTTYKEGRKIPTLYTKAKNYGMSLSQVVVPITCKAEKNDKGMYHVWVIDDNKLKQVPEKYRATIAQWSEMVNSGVELTTDNENAEMSEDVGSAKEEFKDVEEIC